MSEETINFAHHYYKLDDTEFHTVRGKSWFNRCKNKSRFTITKNHLPFCRVVLTAIELKPIKDLSLEFMKKDAEYPGFVIIVREDFITLLNRFRRGIAPKLTEESYVTILYLKKEVQEKSRQGYQTLLTNIFTELEEKP